jgi:hypothetical protein
MRALCYAGGKRRVRDGGREGEDDRGPRWGFTLLATQWRCMCLLTFLMSESSRRKRDPAADSGDLSRRLEKDPQVPRMKERSKMSELADRSTKSPPSSSSALREPEGPPDNRRTILLSDHGCAALRYPSRLMKRVAFEQWKHRPEMLCRQKSIAVTRRDRLRNRVKIRR